MVDAGAVHIGIYAQSVCDTDNAVHSGVYGDVCVQQHYEVAGFNLCVGMWSPAICFAYCGNEHNSDSAFWVGNCVCVSVCAWA